MFGNKKKIKKLETDVAALKQKLTTANLKLEVTTRERNEARNVAQQKDKVLTKIANTAANPSTNNYKKLLQSIAQMARKQ